MDFLIFQQAFIFSSSPSWNSSGLLMVDVDNGMLVVGGHDASGSTGT